MADFGGFPTKTTTFLKRLRANNTKEWFDQHRSEYEQYWLTPAKEFVEAAGRALQELAPVQFEPRINGSIFRINRDIRFSNDKTPYKDYLDMWFWEGARDEAVSGFYLRLGPTVTSIGVGARRFDRHQLSKYRSAVADSSSGVALTKVIRRVEKSGHPVLGDHFKRIPRGLEVTGGTRERLIKHNGLWVNKDQRHPREMRSTEAVPFVVDQWRAAVPVHRWLVDTLQ